MIHNKFKHILDKGRVLELASELQAESERASAIVGAALLDNLLGKIIQAYMVGEDSEIYDELLNPCNINAPLGNFGARISIVYGFGLIPRSTRDALRNVKIVSKAFARKKEVSFSDENISTLCFTLLDLIDLGDDPFLLMYYSPPRVIYETSAAYLIALLELELLIIQKYNVRGRLENVLRLLAK
jgi:DNA-binding MltR family transcriptional regulator